MTERTSDTPAGTDATPPATTTSPIGVVRSVDAENAARDDLVAAVATSQLLPGVDAEAFEDVRRELRAVHLSPGDQLFARGDESDDVFVVVDGVLDATVETMNGRQQLSLLRSGDVIGEIGLLVGDTRAASVRAISEAHLVALSADGFRHLLAEHPVAGEELARRATERLRRTQLIEYFSNLFGVIDLDVLSEVQELMTWVTVPAGTRLFSQGDEGDAAYLVATGRLRVFRRGDNGTEVEIGEVGRAELIGEMSLVDGEPRTSSVDAVRDSQLVRFTRATYEELLNRYPRVGLEVAKMALRRSRGSGHANRDRHPRMSFALVPGSPGIDMDAFATRLADALGDEAHIVTSAQIDEELNRPGISQIDDDDVGALRLAYRLEELEQRHRYLVYRIDDSWTAWSRRALRWSDHVLLVADARQDPEPSALERELWTLVTRQYHSKVSLALLQPGDIDLPANTSAWLAPRAVSSHHHVRQGDQEHMNRLARLLSGRGTSVVLGGGGARGFAHLGVLQVLEEIGAPIDMIGGTSIGSIMAVGPAMGWSADKMRDNALDAFQDLFDYTLPTTSVLRGQKITKKLEGFLGHVDIADLWIPYFCASTNLTHARSEYHDRGSLLHSIRASIAIPGILPPVPSDGELLVDGGVLDNVPVDEMRRRNPTGTIIAVDVAPVDGPVATRDYGLSVSGFRRLVKRGEDAPPNLVSVMVRSSLLASVRDRRRVVDEAIADLYLDVAVDGGDMLDFTGGGEIADRGATATRPVLESFFGPETREVAGYVRTAPTRRTVIAPAKRRQRGALLLTRRDLQHRASRFASVVVGVSVVFTLLFLMTGLTEQFHREPRDTVAAFGADGWMVRDGASGAFTSAATMPSDTADEVDGATADPIVVGRHSLSHGATPVDVVIVGFTPDGLGSPELVDGRAPADAGEIAVDKAAELSVGDTTAIGDQRYTVVGRTERTTLFAGMPLVYMDIEVAQSLLYRGQPLASAILVSGEAEEIPDGFAVLEPAEIAEDATRPLERSISSVNLIRILLWFVAAMIIGTMVYLSALERRRDVAVLKAIGASTKVLGSSIALQGVMVALVAAAIAAVLQILVVPVFPLAVSVPPRALLQVPAIAVLVALAAGGVGLRKAVAIDPALAFAGAGS
jgi:predicted acylesterase/phospholipase RssA/CRP-like cAMP-binding protein